MTATIAIIAVIVLAIGIADSIRAHRDLPMFGPASPQPDEHQSSDLDAKLDRRIAAQVRAINDFHSGSNLTTREQHHV